MRLFGRDVQLETNDERLGTDATRAKGRRGRFATMGELLPILCDPVTKAPLALQRQGLGGGERVYLMPHGNPALFPTDMDVLVQRLHDPDFLRRFPTLSPVEQYCVFGLLKASGDNNNLDHTDAWYERHIFRATKLLKDARGRVLDIGCDDAFLSRGMHHDAVQYIGLEPSTGPSDALRVAGLGEFLPFCNESFDGVSFQTSLDHMLDYQLALSEAWRVLKPGGRLYLATLLWTDRAQLFTDTVHFHHFRPKQLEVALEGFQVESLDCYGWKGDIHRFGVYLRALKAVP